MKTYDLKDAHRGRASFWHNVREVLRRWLDRERELMALRNAVGMMSEARESVDDALMIVESYGPWGADLNDAHRRQIVLADEVLRLRGLYEMAVRGRAEMRSALRQERRAEELHEGCQMPMEQARELAAATACVWNASHCEDAEGILCAWARSLVLRRACADKTVAPRYGA